MQKFLLAIPLLLLFGCASQVPQENIPINTTTALMANNSLQTKPVPPLLPNASQDSSNNSSSLPTVEYYFSPLCGFCERIRPTVDGFEANYSNRVAFEWINVLTNEGFARFDAMANRTNLSQRVVPLIVYNSTVLLGVDEINQSLNALLLNLSG